MQLILSFLATSVLLTLAPGPDIIFVVTKSMSRGARAGISVATGLCTGIFFHTSLAAFGVSLILRESALAFGALKIAGTLYLLWLAFQAFRHRNDVPAGNAETETGMQQKSGNAETFFRLYRTGVLMNVLNPKVALFFLALLPQFVPAGTENPQLHMLLLGGIFAAQGFVVFTIVSLFSGFVFASLLKKRGFVKALNLLTALVLVAIAAAILFATND